MRNSARPSKDTSDAAWNDTRRLFGANDTQSGSFQKESFFMSDSKKRTSAEFKSIGHELIEMFCTDTIYPLNGYWFATGWLAFLLTIVFAISFRLAGLNFDVTQSLEEATTSNVEAAAVEEDPLQMAMEKQRTKVSLFGNHLEKLRNPFSRTDGKKTDSSGANEDKSSFNWKSRQAWIGYFRRPKNQQNDSTSALETQPKQTDESNESLESDVPHSKDESNESREPDVRHSNSNKVSPLDV